ncbi:hypothetical protein IGI37_001495 [Enterococcus sp. AZ194]|uniref:hypothetical protein n=1 Tax=Enterococcus sp. AZ194 TaxID=2774629 RepID=UPI003F28C734
MKKIILFCLFFLSLSGCATTKNEATKDTTTSFSMLAENNHEVEISLLEKNSKERLAEFRNTSEQSFFIDLNEIREEILTEDGWKDSFELSQEVKSKAALFMRFDIPAQAVVSLPIVLENLRTASTYRLTYKLYFSDESLSEQTPEQSDTYIEKSLTFKTK